MSQVVEEKKPEYYHYEEYQNRVQKLKEILNLGMDPYPHKYSVTATSQELTKRFEGESIGSSEEAEMGATPSFSLAGRLVLFRAMGKNAFAHIQDENGRLQLMFNRDHTQVVGLTSDEIKPIKFIEKKIDLGDILGVEGHLFRTHKGELTLYVKKVTLLCKTLLPLPDKHSGLADKGMRYRKRWLDLIANEEVRETFKMRSEILRAVREFFYQNEFLEVETPVLQNIYGGAEAKPFISHLNALHQEMYLRIALEIALKKLIIGGMPKVFEIGKVFRNEGLDRTHNPEFTMLECYAAYWDYEDVMDFTEKLFETIAIRLFGSTKIGKRQDKTGKEHEIDLKTPWKRMTMKESLQVYANVQVDTLQDEEMRALVKKHCEMEPSEIESLSRGQMIAALFEELVEHHLIQPHHITDHPIETTPLCKLHRDPLLRKELFVERFETFILGFEFCNAYSELNDPILQRKLLEQQAEKRNAGDEEASPMDEEFLEAISQGMPPTGGLGVGIDRMTMLFTGSYSIRDVLFFPLMKPEE